MPFGSVVQKRSPVLFAGRMRHKIDIVKPSLVQDSAGGIDLTKNSIYANVWASVEALSGTENMAGGAERGTVTHQIVIRYIGAAPSWQAGNSYSQGNLVKDSNGNLEQIQTPGTSGQAAPDWNATLNGTTTDNSIVWKNIGAAPDRTGVTSAMQVLFKGRLFQILSVLNPDERNKMLILLCMELDGSANQAVTIV